MKAGSTGVGASEAPSARGAVLGLLGDRAPSATVCPSEAARVLAGPGGDWRARMGEVHAAVDALVAEGAVRLSWKGEEMSLREGAYRIALTRKGRG